MKTFMLFMINAVRSFSSFEACVDAWVFCPPTLQLLSGPCSARSRDVTSKRQRRKQRVQPEVAVPVKTEPPQGQVSEQINRPQVPPDNFVLVFIVYLIIYDSQNVL